MGPTEFFAVFGSYFVLFSFSTEEERNPRKDNVNLASNLEQSITPLAIRINLLSESILCIVGVTIRGIQELMHIWKQIAGPLA